MRANSNKFIAKKFPELIGLKKSTSRKYKTKEDPRYSDNWWFKLTCEDIDKHDFIVFAGALDYVNKDFAIYKVPMPWIRDNIKHLDVVAGGWINIYLTMRDHIDVRNKDNLSFESFRLN